MIILNFHPTIIPTDFENALSYAIKESKFFENEVIHIRCLFLFMKVIRDKLPKYGLTNKKMNKENNTLLKNI